MPAKLIVDSGDERSEHWIESPVLRLGASTASDIRLAGNGIRDHHLTIEFRNGGYWVHNRSGSPITVGRRSAPGGASIEFPAGQSLSVSEELQLLLEIDGDSAPAPRFESRRDDGEAFLEDADTDESPESDAETSIEEGDSDQAAASPDAKTILQAGVIGVCMLGCAALLAAKLLAADSGSQPTVTKPLLELSQLATTDWQKRVFEQLQRAEIARLRGNPAAGEVFYRLRDEIVQHDDEPFSKECKRFVQARLESLNH